MMTWLYLLGTICDEPRTPNALTGHVIQYNCHGTNVYITHIQDALLSWLVPALAFLILIGGAIRKHTTHPENTAPHPLNPSLNNRPINQAEWRAFRFWNRLGIYSFATSVPALVAGTLISQTHPFLSSIVLLVGGIGLIVFLATIYWISTFRCPQCHERLMRTPSGGKSTGRKCMHCDFEMY